MQAITGLIAVTVVTASFLVSVERAAACAIAPPPDADVRLTGEEALIVWNAAEQRQHFIRRASFQADITDFGFLVPTPSVPDLEEVGNEVFDRLQVATAPEVIDDPTYMPTTCCLMPLQMSLLSAGDRAAPLEVAGSPSAVEVVATAQVAGMDAAVLAATDPEALLKWLRDHEYAARDALLDWVAPYVEAGWMITAFKIAKDTGARESFGTRAVRMSFDTDRPFYPYREPADGPEQPNRALRVWFVSNARTEGTLGEDRQPWTSTEVLWTAPLEDAESVLANVVPSGQLPAQPHLTEMLDRAVSRPNADVFFGPSEETSEIHRAPRRIPSGPFPIPLPVEPVLLAGGGWWLWRRKKAKRAASA